LTFLSFFEDFRFLQLKGVILGEAAAKEILKTKKKPKILKSPEDH
jgi:hypothetical protein